MDKTERLSTLHVGIGVSRGNIATSIEWFSTQGMAPITPTILRSRAKSLHGR